LAAIPFPNIPSPSCVWLIGAAPNTPAAGDRVQRRSVFDLHAFPHTGALSYFSGSGPDSNVLSIGGIEYRFPSNVDRVERQIGEAKSVAGCPPEVGSRAPRIIPRAVFQGFAIGPLAADRLSAPFFFCFGFLASRLERFCSLFATRLSFTRAVCANMP
jgi:hypothetical protein